MSDTGHPKINELAEGMCVGDFYLLDDVTIKERKDGNAFLLGRLSDATGAIPFVAWNDLGDIRNIDTGSILFVDGTVGLYQGSLQLTANVLTLPAPDDNVACDIADLVPYTATELKHAVEEMQRMLLQLADKDYAGIAISIFKCYEWLITACYGENAAYYTFIGQWVMHTYRMMCNAASAYFHYCNFSRIDYDLLLSAVFLHDSGKLLHFSRKTDNPAALQLLDCPALGLCMIEQEVSRVPGYSTDKVQQLEYLVNCCHPSREVKSIMNWRMEAGIIKHLDNLDRHAELFRIVPNPATPDGNSTRCTPPALNSVLQNPA